MSEFPPAQFQDPDPERAAAFEEWSQFQPPAVFVNYRTACHRAFIAGYNTHRPHIEALERAAQFKRNVIIHDSDNFVGRWVAVPEEDFNALHAALAKEEKPVCDCVPGHLCELHAGSMKP